MTGGKEMDMCNRQKVMGMKDGYKLIMAGSRTEVCRKQNLKEKL